VEEIRNTQGDIINVYTISVLNQKQDLKCRWVECIKINLLAPEFGI
jgi:hypothetical protein